MIAKPPRYRAQADCPHCTKTAIASIIPGDVLYLPACEHLTYGSVVYTEDAPTSVEFSFGAAVVEVKVVPV